MGFNNMASEEIQLELQSRGIEDIETFIKKFNEIESENIKLKMQAKDLTLAENKQSSIIDKLSSKYDLELEGLNDLVEVFEKNAKINSFYNNYSSIQARYDANEVPYQMRSFEDITKVFGVTTYSIKNFNDLTEYEQGLFKEKYVEFLNGWGLGNRFRHLPIKIEKKGNKLTITRIEDIHPLTLNLKTGDLD